MSDEREVELLRRAVDRWQLRAEKAEKEVERLTVHRDKLVYWCITGGEISSGRACQILGIDLCDLDSWQENMKRNWPTDAALSPRSGPEGK